MGLVDYSDSETSDVEDAPPAPTPALPTSHQPSKPAFQKVVDPSAPRKIKVELPAIQNEEGTQSEPPAKRARTAGAFSGFNSLLPAPKRPAAQNAPKAGVGLKTSSEAAFSRVQPPQLEDGDDAAAANGDTDMVDTGAAHSTDADEPKIVGKATKFKPLSVANKKKPALKKTLKSETSIDGVKAKQDIVRQEEQTIAVSDPTPPKPKKSLFSVPQQEENTSASNEEVYHPELSELHKIEENFSKPNAGLQQLPEVLTQANSLQSLTSDLNLTPAQKRQLFGRHAKDGDINISHFNMANEYVANEQLRQAGEVMEHRAIKAIAPGKHSLQQLVNNARSQQDAMEDKWAQGKRDRGEGSAKYGWGR